MKLHWKLFTESSKERSARRVLKWFIDKLQSEASDVTIAPYHKGGMCCTFTTEVVSRSWELAFFESLQLAHRVGGPWSLYGGVEELDAWSNDASITGVSSIHIQLFATEFPTDEA